MNGGEGKITSLFANELWINHSIIHYFLSKVSVSDIRYTRSLIFTLWIAAKTYCFHHKFLLLACPWITYSCKFDMLRRLSFWTALISMLTCQLLPLSFWFSKILMPRWGHVGESWASYRWWDLECHLMPCQIHHLPATPLPKNFKTLTMLLEHHHETWKCVSSGFIYRTM